MGCTLPCRQTADGTKVVIVVPDDVANKPRSYFLASDMTTPWTGDPNDLVACFDGCNPGTKQVENPANITLFCDESAASFEVSVQYIETFQEGWSAFPSAAFTNPNLQALISGTTDVPMPAAPAGSVLLFQLLTGQEDGDVGAAEASQIGSPSLAAPTNSGVAGAPQQLWDVSTNASLYHSVYAFDQAAAGSGGTVAISFPDADPATGTQGVIQGHWIQITRVDGNPLTAAALFDTGGITNQFGGLIPTPDEIEFTGFSSPAECPSIALGFGRHISYEGTEAVQGPGLMFDQSPSFAWDFSAGTELHDTSSMSGPHNYPGGNFCNVGASAAFIPANTPYGVNVRPNLGEDSAADAAGGLMFWTEQAQMVDIPLLCSSPTDCEPNGPTVSMTVPDSTCDDYEISISANVEVTLATGVELRLVPKINGVADAAGAVVYDSSGSQNFSYTLPTSSAMATVSLCVEVVAGDGKDSNLAISNQEFCLRGVA